MCFCHFENALFWNFNSLCIGEEVLPEVVLVVEAVNVIFVVLEGSILRGSSISIYVGVKKVTNFNAGENKKKSIDIFF